MSWDMSEEHRWAYGNDRFYDTAESVIRSFDIFEERTGQENRLYPMCYAVDLFRCGGQDVRETIKQVFLKYADIIYGDIQARSRAGEIIRNFSFKSRYIMADALENVLLKIYSFDIPPKMKTAPEFNYEDLDLYRREIQFLANDIFEKLGTVSQVSLYEIDFTDKSCEKDIFARAYLGIAVRIYYILYNDYCILIVYGSNE